MPVRSPRIGRKRRAIRGGRRAIIPILHTASTLYFTGGQPQFNVGLYPGKVSRKPLVSPGVVKIICEVHPWMSAYIVVTDHPYYSVTDVYGEYLISDIPAGSYTAESRRELWVPKKNRSR